MVYSSKSKNVKDFFSPSLESSTVAPGGAVLAQITEGQMRVLPHIHYRSLDEVVNEGGVSVISAESGAGGRSLFSYGVGRFDQVSRFVLRTDLEAREFLSSFQGRDRMSCLWVVLGDKLTEDQVESVFSGIKTFSEEGSSHQPGIIVQMSDRNPLRNSRGATDLGDANVYRISYFTNEEISSIVEVESHKEKCAIAEACFKWTGGNPLLVNLYLRFLQSSGQTLSPQLLDLAGQYLVSSPPQVTSKWSSFLEEICGRDNNVNPIIGLANGDSLEKGGGDLAEDLFLGGWTKLIPGTPSGSPHWEIRSQFHARLARKVARSYRKK